MKFRIQREVFLQPLSQVVGVVERRQTLPVLANFLIVARDGTLSVTGTDMEVELVGSVAADITQEGEITLPARKLVDIVKALPDGSTIDVAIQDEKATMLAGKSRYTLATLPASEFPATDRSTVFSSSWAWLGASAGFSCLKMAGPSPILPCGRMPDR